MITYCPTGSEIMFHGVDYSELNIKRLLRDYYSLRESCMYKSNFELVSVLSDIETSMSNSGLTDSQRKTVMLYMKGYTEAEIGSQMGSSQQNIHKVISRACEKMSTYLSDCEVE